MHYYNVNNDRASLQCEFYSNTRCSECFVAIFALVWLCVIRPFIFGHITLKLDNCFAVVMLKDDH